MRRSLLLRLAALGAFLCPVAARGAAVGSAAPATGHMQIAAPATFVKLYDLDFGNLSVTAAGTAIVDSNTGLVSTTGGVLLIGGTPHAAGFDSVSPTKNTVKIGLPKQATVLTRVGGTETMTLDTWAVNGALTRNVVAHQEIQFQVGGTLHVNANQAEGIYLGSFDVTINYN